MTSTTSSLMPTTSSTTSLVAGVDNDLDNGRCHSRRPPSTCTDTVGIALVVADVELDICAEYGVFGLGSRPWCLQQCRRSRRAPRTSGAPRLIGTRLGVYRTTSRTRSPAATAHFRSDGAQAHMGLIWHPPARRFPRLNWPRRDSHANDHFAPLLETDPYINAPLHQTPRFASTASRGDGTRSDILRLLHHPVAPDSVPTPKHAAGAPSPAPLKNFSRRRFRCPWELASAGSPDESLVEIPVSYLLIIERRQTRFYFCVLQNAPQRSQCDTGLDFNNNLTRVFVLNFCFKLRGFDSTGPSIIEKSSNLETPSNPPTETIGKMLIRSDLLRHGRPELSSNLTCFFRLTMIYNGLLFLLVYDADYLQFVVGSLAGILFDLPAKFLRLAILQKPNSTLRLDVQGIYVEDWDFTRREDESIFKSISGLQVNLSISFFAGGNPGVDSVYGREYWLDSSLRRPAWSSDLNIHVLIQAFEGPLVIPGADSIQLGIFPSATTSRKGLSLHSRWAWALFPRITYFSVRCKGVEPFVSRSASISAALTRKFRLPPFCNDLDFPLRLPSGFQPTRAQDNLMNVPTPRI
ncbi:hypothetical protein C8R43DRAFT_1133689 [Mycena crocata]|nr:hypothetical protein C8R43DRAFT_1133689 [Mycena crocata]